MDSTVIEEKEIIFETFNEEDVSVLIYSGNREVSVKRNIALSKGFLKMMMNSFR